MNGLITTTTFIYISNSDMFILLKKWLFMIVELYKINISKITGKQNPRLTETIIMNSNILKIDDIYDLTKRYVVLWILLT